MADTWIPIRPGTDAALALAMLHIVIGEDLIDQDFIETWCYGFNRLKVHVRQFTPQCAEKICGVGSDQIKEIAHLYGTTPRATIDLGNGVEHSPSSSDAIRAVTLLMAVTGHLDCPGANLFISQPKNTPRDISLKNRYSENLITKLVGPEFPIAFQPFLEGPASAYYRIFESVLNAKPYPIRPVIAPGTQPSVSTRGTKKVIAALQKLDFFVVVDVFRTADMPYADIVIPVATGYEVNHPFQMVPGWLMATRKVIELVGENKSIFEFFLDLGVAMGYGKDFWSGYIETAMDDQLASLGMEMQGLRQQLTGIKYQPADHIYEKYETAFKRTSPRLGSPPYLPQGKVALYNTSFEAARFSPLPNWHEPPESLSGTPELAKQYQLILSDYHTSKNFSSSWQRNVSHLREIQPEPVLHIHPSPASARQIKEGDWLMVESPHGWMKVKAEIYPGIHPDTVMILHGLWQGCKELDIEDYPLAGGGANVNNMYKVDPVKAYDPLVTAMTSQTLVQVEK